ncbi:hypothetical protein EJB05_35855, partial [Eragrostis curvula]
MRTSPLSAPLVEEELGRVCLPWKACLQHHAGQVFEACSNTVGPRSEEEGDSWEPATLISQSPKGYTTPKGTRETYTSAQK